MNRKVVDYLVSSAGLVIAVVLLAVGGLMVWGLNPGPLLFVEHKDFVWGLIASMYRWPRSTGPKRAAVDRQRHSCRTSPPKPCPRPWRR